MCAPRNQRQVSTTVYMQCNPDGSQPLAIGEWTFVPENGKIMVAVDAEILYECRRDGAVEVLSCSDERFRNEVRLYSEEACKNLFC